MSFMEEIMKIPPVTRFLCASSLVVTGPVLVHMMAPYKWYYVKEYVTKGYEFWRLATTFCLGSPGLQYLFDLITLYQTSERIESSYYTRRSADYAYQLFCAALAIFALNIPLQSHVLSRPLLICLVYLSSRLLPPGTQTSIFGLVTIPITYYPFLLIAFDLIVGGHRYAACSITGAIVGHLWWWGVWDTRAAERYGAAPRWLKALISHSEASGGTGGSGGSFASGSGVTVVPGRVPLARSQIQTPAARPVRPEPSEAARATAHAWGGGQRLGS
ncbi:DER1-domain-containing protein [Cristinia sonorae]|uniref:Derlin n=1 Tax=Cristinia sonorae TaxID=1940300 RepID=A0A8K0URK7_9AGAR|nr:DER1-domain-containing protein [Cristinia sonorae]